MPLAIARDFCASSCRNAPLSTALYSLVSITNPSSPLLSYHHLSEWADRSSSASVGSHNVSLAARTDLGCLSVSSPCKQIIGFVEPRRLLISTGHQFCESSLVLPDFSRSEETVWGLSFAAIWHKEGKDAWKQTRTQQHHEGHRLQKRFKPTLKVNFDGPKKKTDTTQYPHHFCGVAIYGLQHRSHQKNNFSRLSWLSSASANPPEKPLLKKKKR